MSARGVADDNDDAKQSQESYASSYDANSLSQSGSTQGSVEDKKSESQSESQSHQNESSKKRKGGEFSDDEGTKKTKKDDESESELENNIPEKEEEEKQSVGESGDNSKDGTQTQEQNENLGPKQPVTEVTLTTIQPSMLNDATASTDNSKEADNQMSDDAKNPEEEKKEKEKPAQQTQKHDSQQEGQGSTAVPLLPQNAIVSNINSESSLSSSAIQFQNVPQPLIHAHENVDDLKRQVEEGKKREDQYQQQFVQLQQQLQHELSQQRNESQKQMQGLQEMMTKIFNQKSDAPLEDSEKTKKENEKLKKALSDLEQENGGMKAKIQVYLDQMIQKDYAINRLTSELDDIRKENAINFERELQKRISQYDDDVRNNGTKVVKLQEENGKLNEILKKVTETTNALDKELRELKQKAGALEKNKQALEKTIQELRAKRTNEIPEEEISEFTTTIVSASKEVVKGIFQRMQQEASLINEIKDKSAEVRISKIIDQWDDSLSEALREFEETLRDSVAEKVKSFEKHITGADSHLLGEIERLKKINSQRLGAINTQMALVMREQFARACTDTKRYQQAALINNITFDNSVNTPGGRVLNPNPNPLPPIPKSMHQFINSFLMEHNIIPVYIALFVQFRIICTSECAKMKQMFADYKDTPIYNSLDAEHRKSTDTKFTSFNNGLELLQARALSYSRMLSTFLKENCVDVDLSNTFADTSDCVKTYVKRTDEILYRFNNELELRNNEIFPRGEHIMEQIEIFIYRLMRGYNSILSGEDADLASTMKTIGAPIKTDSEESRISSALYWMLIFCFYFADEQTRPVFKEKFSDNSKGSNLSILQENVLFLAIKQLFIKSGIDKGAMTILDHEEYGENKKDKYRSDNKKHDAYVAHQDKVTTHVAALKKFRTECEVIFAGCLQHSKSNDSFKNINFLYYHDLKKDRDIKQTPVLACALGFLPFALHLSTPLFETLDEHKDFVKFKNTVRSNMADITINPVLADMFTHQIFRFYGWIKKLKEAYFLTETGKMSDKAMKILKFMYPYDRNHGGLSNNNWIKTIIASPLDGKLIEEFLTDRGIPKSVYVELQDDLGK